MTLFFTTSIGRLRLLGFLEGLSLILLVFVAMPLKYIWQNPAWVKTIGMAHGLLFLLFVSYVFIVSSEMKWKFREITWNLLWSSVVPFGTMYMDHKILSKIQDKE